MDDGHEVVRASWPDELKAKQRCVLLDGTAVCCCRVKGRGTISCVPAGSHSLSGLSASSMCKDIGAGQASEGRGKL
ncbi:hypothetical protein NDU88_006498 [Pleurodeles waltl]|uniref:Uncharacterized protein n=1 Tax=Pleurodeles waltl TaxID=8319 RepID=A0AAV7SPT0_PLEWA|nr:hypothetical protein NDU88_006498 [Pleurodeles waltl]